MKKLIVKLIAKILDKWGYKFSITKEEHNSIYIQSNIAQSNIAQSNIAQSNMAKANLYIENNSNVGIGSIRTELDNKLHISDVRQRLINRIVQLKEQRKNLYGGIENNKNSPIRMSISSETSNFYEYTYDKLIKELEDILNAV